MQGRWQHNNGGGSAMPHDMTMQHWQNCAHLAERGEWCNNLPCCTYLLGRWWHDTKHSPLNNDTKQHTQHLVDFFIAKNFWKSFIASYHKKIQSIGFGFSGNSVKNFFWFRYLFQNRWNALKGFWDNLNQKKIKWSRTSDTIKSKQIVHLCRGPENISYVGENLGGTVHFCFWYTHMHSNWEYFYGLP